VHQVTPPTTGGHTQEGTMEPYTVGLLSPGDMGHAVGRVLVEHGVRVITCLEGRSDRTRALAAEAGIENVATLRELVTQAPLVLSIVVPAQARNVAERVARAITDTGAPVDLTFADCNAIAPQTALEVERIVTTAGARFVDAGIIGSPPGEGGRNRIYVSGKWTEAMLALNTRGLEVVDLHGEVGRASGLKMCYAALTKGLTALCTELLVAAQVLGISEPLEKEFRESQGAMLTRMERGVPAMLPKAHRWVGEMEEIAATFGALGLTPDMLHGAAEVYRLVAGTPLATYTPEDPRPLPGLGEVIASLSKGLA
jgi:3-hydroxyisobutyrate dehydrogenase-like beta-hydroxyacid dehydrogenase